MGTLPFHEFMRESPEAPSQTQGLLNRIPSACFSKLPFPRYPWKHVNIPGKMPTRPGNRCSTRQEKQMTSDELCSLTS